jgi:pimeloyl-ACP methyl ester carboxylesterase
MRPWLIMLGPGLALVGLQSVQAQVTIDITKITCNELKWQELRDVVVVGHSYGGMVISGVAEKMEKAIASFVMLDAFMPENAQSTSQLCHFRTRAVQQTSYIRTRSPHRP